MKKKNILTLLCITAVCLTALAFKGHSSVPPPTASKSQQSQTGATADPKQSPRPADAPEHIIYRMFFHHLMALKDRAADLERKGKNGKGLRSYYKDKARLNDDQARTLDQIAADCEREVESMDAKAKAIIDAFRARLLMKNSRKDGMPPPPTELQIMQQQRDTIILHARQRLRTALGAQAFQQLDDFIKLDAQRNSAPAGLKPAPSVSPQGSNR